MRIDKSNPLLYSELCESRMEDQSILDSMISTSQQPTSQKPFSRVAPCQQAAPTLREQLKNLIDGITHLLIGSQY